MNEMRFPLSREDGGNASALSPAAEAAAGSPSGIGTSRRLRFRVEPRGALEAGVEIVSRLATRRLTFVRVLGGGGARERRPHTEETADQNAGRSRQQK